MLNLAAILIRASSVNRKVASDAVTLQHALQHMALVPTTAAAAQLADDHTATTSQLSMSAATFTAPEGSAGSPSATTAGDDAVNHRLPSAATLDATALCWAPRSSRKILSPLAPASGTAVGDCATARDVDVVASPLASVASALDVRHPSNCGSSSYVARTALLDVQRRGSTVYGSMVDADSSSGGSTEKAPAAASRGASSQPAAGRLRGALSRVGSARLLASSMAQPLTAALFCRVQHRNAAARMVRAQYNGLRGLRGVGTVSSVSRPVSACPPCALATHIDFRAVVDYVRNEDAGAPAEMVARASALANMAATAAAEADGASQNLAGSMAAAPQDGAQKATMAATVETLEADNKELKADNKELKAKVETQGETIKTLQADNVAAKAEAERLNSLAAVRSATELPVKLVLRRLHPQLEAELGWKHQYSSISHLLKDLKEAASEAEDKDEVKKYKAFAAKVRAAADAALLTKGALRAITALRGVANPVIHAQRDFESAEAMKDALRKGTLGLDADTIKARVADVDEWYPAYEGARAEEAACLAAPARA